MTKKTWNHRTKFLPPVLALWLFSGQGGAAEPAALQGAASIESPALENIPVCSGAGKKEGKFACRKNMPNGASEDLLMEQEWFGNVFKRQIRINDNDGSNRTVRQKIHYTEAEIPRAEFYDIVSRPQNQKIIRDIIIYQYHPSTRRLKNFSWTRYKQIERGSYAAIMGYVSLDYDRNGRPLNAAAAEMMHPFLRQYEIDENRRRVSGALKRKIQWKIRAIRQIGKSMAITPIPPPELVPDLTAFKQGAGPHFKFLP